ncbi:MAG: hypothetical protein NT154_25625, partial [Verrucomicrobia bacterium]|nr:hypothetical protein [Verrucomicrobiota bacterium]
MQPLPQANEVSGQGLFSGIGLFLARTPVSAACNRLFLIVASSALSLLLFLALHQLVFHNEDPHRHRYNEGNRHYSSQSQIAETFVQESLHFPTIYAALLSRRPDSKSSLPFRPG